MPRFFISLGVRETLILFVVTVLGGSSLLQAKFDVRAIDWLWRHNVMFVLLGLLGISVLSYLVRGGKEESDLGR